MVFLYIVLTILIVYLVQWILKKLDTPSSTPSRNHQRFYHYTSTDGAKGIRNAGVIKSNNGVMLSTLRPENYTRETILQSIHGNTIPPNCRNRADNIVVVDSWRLQSNRLAQIKPNLYKYTGDVRINANDVRDKPSSNGSSSGPSFQGSASNSNSQRGPGSSTFGAATQSNVFYFYTSKDSAAKIKSTRYIFSGGLLTTMTPEKNFRDEILKAIYGANYDRTKHATSADWCVRIDKTKLDASKLKKKHNEVYEYSDTIKVDASDVVDKPKCTKNGGGAGSSNDYLYHYTNRSGADAIKAGGYLKKSGSSGAFGPGVYMTNLKPNDFFRDDILKNNYGGINAAFKGRADWVVQIKRSNLIQSKLKQVGSNVTMDGSRQIFVYDDEITVQNSNVYDKPPCYRAK